jgi:site-specific DNA recombinase
MPTPLISSPSNYKEWIGTLTRVAMERRVEDGRIPGKVPVGYRSLGNGHVEPDPVIAPLVREAFLLAAEGMPLRKISAALSDKGLVNSHKRPLGPSTLQKVLANPFYVGKVRIGSVEHAGCHEALISNDLYEAVMRR